MANTVKRSAKLSGKGKTILPDYPVSEFNGLNTYIADLKNLADGESPDSLNWITGKYKDNIQLRRGKALLGTTRRTGIGRISGLGVGSMSNGTQIPFFSYAQKILYFNSQTDTTVEVNTSNVMPTAAASDDVSIMPYENITGSAVYFTSPNSSIYKIVTANPADISDLQSTAFRGTAKIDTNRMFMWNRKDNYRQNYQNNLFIGVSDHSDISQYTQTTAENPGSLTGDGTTKSFMGTLAFRSNPALTCFYTEFAAPIATGIAITGITAAVQAVVTVSAHTFNVKDAVLINGVLGMTQINGLIGIVMATTATTITISINSSSFSAYTGSAGDIYLSEYFVDDNNGNLSTSLGGTGTINYTTGAFVLNFNTAPINGQAVIAQYYVEASTSGGVADFTINGSVTGQGKQFNQFDGGGSLNGVFPFDQVQYCFHVLKTWYLNLGTDDTKASNLPYRSNLGIPYFRGGFPTDDGIVFLDNSYPAHPKVKILEIDNNSATAVVTVVPNSVSDMLDLSSFGFFQVAIFRWGDYDVMACQGQLNGVTQSINTIFFCRNIFSGQWDKFDYSCSSFAEYNGSLLAGDSFTNNVFTLFSGLDDDGFSINNYWKTKLYDLGIQGIKKTHRFVVKGLIQQNQTIQCFFSFDSGAFVNLCTVLGNASYVNLGQPITIGSSTLGLNVVGGGGSTIVAYPFEVEFTIPSDIYEYVQVMFQAGGLGFAQIDEFVFKDNRYKGRKITPSRVVTL